MLAVGSLGGRCAQDAEYRLASTGSNPVTTSPCRDVQLPKAVFVLNDDSEHAIEVARFESLMRAAVRNNVDGIAGECGGGLSCATCHVYVDEAWADRLPPPNPGEEDMLQFTAAERRPTSRLCCQLRMAQELAGIRVKVPETQY